MDKIHTIASKFRLLGNEVQILTSNSILVYNKNKLELTGYRLVDNRIESVDYNIECGIQGSDNYFRAIKDNNIYILDRYLNRKLKFSNEKPILIVDEAFVLLDNTSTRTKRVIDINGDSVTITLAWKVEIYRNSDNQLVILTEYNSGQNISIAENNKSIKYFELFTLDRTNYVFIGDKYIIIRYKHKNKVIVFDYKGNITLSVPEGKVSVKDKILVLDKVGKLIKQINPAGLVYK